MSIPLNVLGAVFVGGESSRMGTDKALVDFNGAPLAAVAIEALRGAGIDKIVLVGASAEHIDALGVVAAEELWPGEGPAGAVLSSLHAAFLGGANTVVSLSCDLPAVTAAAVRSLLDATPGFDAEPAVVIGTDDGRRAYPNGVWQTRLLPTLEGHFVDEASSVAELIGDVAVIEVAGGGAFADADDPEALDGFR